MEVLVAVLGLHANRPEIEARDVARVEAQALILDDAPGLRVRWRQAAQILQLDIVAVAVDAQVDQVVAYRIERVVRRVGLHVEVLLVAVGREVVVVEDAADLHVLLAIDLHLALHETRDQVLVGEGNGRAFPVFIIVLVVLADRAGDAERTRARAGGAHLGKSDAVAAPAQHRDAADVLAVPDDVGNVERAEIGGAGERARAARGRDRAALHVDAGDQQRVDIGEALRLVPGEAEVLAHAVDHHVDAARAFKAANIHGNAGVARAFAREGAGDRAQHFIEARLAEGLDLALADGAYGGWR